MSNVASSQTRVFYTPEEVLARTLGPHNQQEARQSSRVQSEYSTPPLSAIVSEFGETTDATVSNLLKTRLVAEYIEQEAFGSDVKSSHATAYFANLGCSPRVHTALEYRDCDCFWGRKLSVSAPPPTPTQSAMGKALEVSEIQPPHHPIFEKEDQILKVESWVADVKEKEDLKY